MSERERASVEPEKIERKKMAQKELKVNKEGEGKKKKKKRTGRKDCW